DCVQEGDTVFFHPSLHNQTINLLSNLISIDKDIVISSNLVNPRIMIYSGVNGAFYIAPGKTVEMKNIEITSGVMGGSVLGAGVENMGNLILWDVCIFRNPSLGFGDYLIFNGSTGQITIKGTCHFQD